MDVATHPQQEEDARTADKSTISSPVFEESV